MHESIIFFANTTFVWAPHYLPFIAHAIVQYSVSPDHPFLHYMPYNIGNNNIVVSPPVFPPVCPLRYPGDGPTALLFGALPRPDCRSVRVKVLVQYLPVSPGLTPV